MEGQWVLDEVLLGLDERQEADKSQHLCEADRGDHHQQTRPVVQAAQRELAACADRGCQEQHDRQCNAVRHVPVRGQVDEQDGGRRAELALREVEHPAGPVDEDEAHREEAVLQTDGDAVDDR